MLMQGGAVNVNGTDIPQRILPSGSGQIIDQTLFLPVIHEMVQEGGAVLDQPMIIVVDRANSLADSENLGRAGDTRPNLTVFENSQGDIIVIASTIQNRKVVNSVMETTTSAQSPTLMPLFERTERKKATDSLLIVFDTASTEQEPGLLPAARQAAGYQMLAATNGNVYRRQISDRGRTVGPLTRVFEHDGTLQSMSGAEILATDQASNTLTGEMAELLIIWQKEVTEEHHEVRAHFHSIKR